MTLHLMTSFINQPVVIMPPKRSAAKAKGKAKEVRNSDTESPTANIEAVEGEGPLDTRMDIEEKIADFFEERPFFYNQGDSDYKNKQKRNTELLNFAAVLGQGHTADNIWKRFVSIRTDIGKIKRLISQGKSGQGAKKLTMLQQWKLRRYAFLDSYLKPRVLCEELGKDIEDDGTEDGDETGSFDHEEDADLGTTTTTGAIQSIGERTKKKPKTSSSVVNVLQSLLDVTRQDMRAADQRVERLCADEKAKAGDERTAWGQWLTSACLAVPAQSFRQFQRDTFEATMRYLPAVTVAGSPRMPPPSQVFPVSLPAFQQQQPPQLPDQQQSYLSMLHDNEQTTINETTSDNMSSGRSAKTKSTASLIAQAFQAVNIPSVHSSQDLASEARQTQQTMSSSPSTQVEDRSLYPLANQQQK